jgi:oligopeptide transport system substrate-binding protein
MAADSLATDPRTCGYRVFCVDSNLTTQIRAGSLLVSALLSCATLLVACREQSSSPQTTAPAAIKVGTSLAADQTVTRSLVDMPRTLDPSLLTDIYAQAVTDDLFEGLTILGADGRMLPGVATSWETSPDGKHWVFHLRPEARWSNGDPVTAADFLYAWHRTLDPKTGSEYAQALGVLAGALAIATGQAPQDTLGVSAPDAHTIDITLVAPTPYLLALLGDSFMQPEHRATIERYGDDWTRPEHMVSNGPFVLRELIIGDRITLAKNEHYWNAAAVHPTRVVYYPLDQVAQVGRYLAGDIQYADEFPSEQFRYLKDLLGAQVQTTPLLAIDQLGFNMLRPPFAANRNLRMALTMALDREVLAAKVRQGAEFPAYTLVPPLPGYSPVLPEWASWSDARRHAEARRLYAAAGYSGAHPLRVQLDYDTSESSRDLFDAITAMWRTNLGAEIEPYNEEFRVLLQDLRLHKSLLFSQNWTGDYPDPYTFLQLYQTGFDENFSGTSDPTIDALLQAGTNEPGVAGRYAEFRRAEARLNEDADFIPYLYRGGRHLIKPYLMGWHLNVLDRIPSRYLYVLEHEGN